MQDDVDIIISKDSITYDQIKAILNNMKSEQELIVTKYGEQFNCILKEDNNEF